jgi:hypothetical protein
VAGDDANWSVAITATRTAGDPYLLAYALLRHAEVACAAADRESASLAVQEAARLATALGAAPLLADITALARRARVRIDGDAPRGRTRGDGIDAFGLTQREREVLSCWPSALEPADRRGALHQPQDGERARIEILGKLGVASRGEAAAVAHRLGLQAAASPTS